ncbi:MAG: 16S rRNA (adenine(1518)-N(6)/adenine(1519)-N(6))-dimethyltransferase RsmA [Deltaproteobacteria bacterium]|nr:16S rRNA (adenine(1518)-N(6)/adenine(1519)-N(6))-dimethyltransferase RsmA [Deltaproteobacteria bacterium]
MSEGDRRSARRPPSDSSARSLLERHGIRPSRRKGQSFLIQPDIARRIALAAEIPPGATVIEIGSGLGILTRAMAPLCRRLLAVEIDSRLVRVLSEEGSLPPNVEVIEGDALETDLGAMARRWRAPALVVSNLPYAASTPLLFRLLEAGPVIQRWVLMLQREVAERILAAPGSKVYGALTVPLQLFTDVERLFSVGRMNFHPRPDVDSVVLRFDVRPPEASGVTDPALLRAVVRAAFGRRRKTLANALAPLVGEGGSALLEEAGIDPRARGETLAPGDFARLANALHRAGLEAVRGA